MLLKFAAQRATFCVGVILIIFSVPLLSDQQVNEPKIEELKTNAAVEQPVVKPSITLVALATPNLIEFSQYTIRSFVDYAWKWGYQFHLCTTSLEPARHPAWSKIKLFQSLLKDGASDWYVWLDADLIITNPDIPMEKFISEYGSKADVIVSIERRDGLERQDDINSGMFLVRNSPWARYFLQRVWDVGYQRFANQHGWEQSAIEELLKTDEFRNNEKFKKAPVRCIQSLLRLVDKEDKNDYELWRPGDFAAHMVGATTGLRSFVLSQLAENSAVYPEVPEMLQPWWVFKQEHVVANQGG